MRYRQLRRLVWRACPAFVQGPLLRLLRWPEYSTTLAVRAFAKYSRLRFRDELVISPTGEIWFKDAKSGGEFYVPSEHTDWIGRGVSEIEPFESALLASNLGQGVMLDIGANVGIHSVRVALRHPEARIFAFEPVSANYQVLVKNIARNGLAARVSASRAAVGAAPGAVTMPASFGTGNWVGGTIRGSRSEEVPLLAIDSFLAERGIGRVNVVKCDVEGYELAVLQGMTACLQHLRPRLLIEVDETWCARLGVHAADVFALLESLDYEYMRVVSGAGIKPRLLSGNETQADTNNFWFYPKETGPGQVDAVA